MARVTLLLATIAAAVLLPASACWACSCALAEPEQYWEWADAVFDGHPTDRSAPDADGMITWTFEVVDVWKGEVAAVQQLKSHQHGATCGMSFELGTTYRVYAGGASDAMTTNLCSGSAPREQFPDGPPAQPDPGDATPKPESSEPDQPVPSDGEPPDIATPVTPSDEPGSPIPNSPDPVDDPGADDEVTVPVGGSGAGLVALVAGAGGLGLLGLAAWLIRRGGPA